MLRDDFIAQMIAELTRQKDIDENSFNYPRVCSPKEIFQSLCFDFPIISAAELLILSDHVSEFAASSSYDQLSNNFSLTDKFLENLKYLSGSPDRSGEIEREKAISSLCAAVFLRLPVRLLSMSRRELSSFFCCLSSSPESQSGCYDPDFIPFESPLLSWQQICSLYRHFVLQGTASLLSNIEVTMLVWNSNSKIISSDSKGHMVALSEAISRIQWDKNSGKSSKKHEFDLLTLEQCFVFNCEKASKADDVHADSTTNIDLLDTAANDDITNANGEVSESSFISSVAKDVWVHLSFLCRDLLVHYPEIINHSSALPSVLTALLPPNICRGPSSSFPTAPECMFVLILSGVISGITTTPPSLPSHNTLQGASEEGGTTAMVLQDSHERLLLRVSKSLDARTKLCKYLEASSPSLLATAVGICERMSRGSTNCDGAVLLCDISLLYTTDMKYAIPHPHEHLIATRAISALAQMWISAASSHFKVIETADNSFIPSSSATGMHAVASR